MNKLRLKCVNCQNELTYHNNELRCDACQKVFEIKQNIPIINQAKNYYGELSKEEMSDLLDDCNNRPWRQVIEDKILKKNTNEAKWLYKIITDSTRSDYAFLLPMNKQSTVLDVGAGWGQTTIPLASRVKRITALDATWQRLSFINKVSKQQGQKNIDYLCSSILDLPLYDNSYDFVTMMGVLEWVAESVDKGDPRDLQIKALKEILRVIKPGGYFIMGIEGSHGYKYQLGEPDDHTGLKHITYLDRQAANKLSQEKRGTDYRTYTYTMQGYKELFECAGFTKNKLQFYYPSPDYKITSCFLPLNNLNTLRFYHNYINFPHDELSRKVKIKELLAINNKQEMLNSAASYIIIAQK